MLPTLTTEAGARRVAYFAVACAVAAFALREAAGVREPDFPYDDAYIVLHNARALLAGRDTRYEGVSPLFGATSAMHLGAVALVARAVSPPWASYVVASLGTCAYALGLLRLAFAHRWSAPAAALLAALGLSVAEVPHQLYNGLETGLALAGLTWGLAGYAACSTPDGTVAPARWLLVLTGALPFLRPEFAALSLMLAASVAVDRARRGALVPRDVARDLAWVALGALPWALWYAVETGAPWPQTAGAKRAFFAEECYPPRFRLSWLVDGLRGLCAMVGAASLGALFLVRTRLGRIGIAFAALLCATYFARMPSAFHLYERRYLYVLIPLMLYGVASAWRSPRPWVRGAAAVLVAAGLAQSLPEVGRRYRGHRDYCRIRAGEYRAVAGWCRANVPPRARVLIHDAGFIAWDGDFALTDLVGLKSPASVPVNRRRILATCGRDRAQATAQIAAAARAEYLLVLVDWDRDYYKFSRALASSGWRVERRYTSPLALYELYALTPP